MKLFFRLIGIWLLLGCVQAAWPQETGPKIDSVNIQYVGPESISKQFILSNVRTKAGDTYLPTSTQIQDDIHSLYATGKFRNIRVETDQADDGGVNLTFVVESRPIITAIKLEGNKKVSDSKLKKKITVKVGEPLDEVKLFEDVQAIKKLYEKYGYPDTQVKYDLDTMDEAAGRASVTFQIVEGRKIKIEQVDFIGASAFPLKELRKQIKTKRHWMFSWLTGSGVFKQDQFDDDKDTLTEFYRSRGYLDFAIKDVKLVYPTPDTMEIQFYVSEGRQYKVGAVTFTGVKLLDTNAVSAGYKPGPPPKSGPELPDWIALRNLNRDFTMKTGSTFTSAGMDKDTTAIEDFYGSKGYIDVAQGQGLNIVHTPNVETGTMDLQFQVDQGQKYYVEKIDIRGNLKTKDKVIRRELAISPGEVFDMVRVKLSKQRLENLGYFTPDKVDLEPEPTDPPIAGRKDLVVNVEEQNTGNFTVGAGFSSVEQLTAFGEITQGNFDLFHPPYFTGGGQKLRLFVQVGTQEQDYELEFTEPWFLNRKLALDVDLYRRQLNYESPNNLFDESRTGMRVGLTRALWSDFFIGGVSYTIENVGITLNQPYNPASNAINTLTSVATPGVAVPNAISSQVGNHVFNRFGGLLAYDTRNSTQLPNHGQRTEFDPELDVGDQTTYYKLALKSSWYFPGFFKGHVIEFDGRAGVAQSVGSGDVPFYDRYYLGGAYDLRGFIYRNISPRESDSPEPIGGDSYWFGSLEYSIPIIEKESGGPSLRLALFMDAGAVGAQPYSFSGNFDDDWGIGFRLNIPHLGPLRLDYGIPITHDSNNGSSGQFQFTVGYTRQF